MADLYAEINYTVSGSGTGNYNELSNKPSINGVTLQGNLTTKDIGVKDGENGKDGFSPTVSQVANQSGYEIKITDINGTDTFQLNNGRNGANGKSAYLIAVANGFQGTEQEWLNSLDGKDGTDGVDGTNGTNGKSAYQVALDNGFVGSEQEWLESLKGKDGSGVSTDEVNRLIDVKVPEWSRKPNPPKTSEIENDSDFQNGTQVQEKINASIGDLTGISISVVDVLPETGKPNIIYLVPSSKKAEKNIYDEYIWVTDKFEIIGSTDIDLSQYALKSELFSKNYNDLTNTPTIPTKVSELTNDSDFQNGTQIETTLSPINESIASLENDKVNYKSYTLASDKITQLDATTILNDYGNFEGRIIEFLTNGEHPNKSVGYGVVIGTVEGDHFLMTFDKNGVMTQWNKTDYRKSTVEYSLLSGLIECDSLTMDSDGETAKYYAGILNGINKPPETSTKGAMIVLPYDRTEQIQLYVDTKDGSMYKRTITGTDGQHSFGVWSAMAGVTKEYVDGLVGNINSFLDKINGEVI